MAYSNGLLSYPELAEKIYEDGSHNPCVLIA